MVVSWLRGLGWTVFQEVQARSYGRSIDIVAVNGPVLWVVETKLSLSLDVVEQALAWAGNAHYVSVAVPKGSRRAGSLLDGNLMREVLNWKGVGLLLVAPGTVAEMCRPLLHRRVNARPLRESLCNAQQTYAPAGNADNQRWSPFKKTCEQVSAIVRDRPGITTPELLSRLRHHWNTGAAESNLFRLGQENGIEGVRMRRESGVWRWYPVADGRNLLTRFL